ncbi:MAG: ThiF family adenylyltransferase [Planctomycetes bacterium]|nr:ThiF family adenylyltransferase [Planctomycetota bacterium]
MTQHSRTERLLERLAGERGIAGQLGAGRVTLVVPAHEAANPQAQLIATFTANLAARLFPVVRQLNVHLPRDAILTASVPRWTGSTLGGSLTRFFRALDPSVTCAVNSGQAADDNDVTVVFGSAGDVPATVYAGGTGWVAQLSTEGHVPIAGSPNPVGAYTTAAFTVAEIWKQLLAPYGYLFPYVPMFPLHGDFAFSAFDYRHKADGPNPELPDSFSLGRLTTIGLGAGGAGAAYTLASLPDLRGQMRLIEPDEATLSNLNRLVVADAGDVRKKQPKVSIVAELLRRFPQLSVEPHASAFDAVRPSLRPTDYARVLAAVHSRAARHSIQLETPSVLWDAAATSTGEFHVWRVAFGRTQCLACRLASEDRDPEREKSRQLETLLGQPAAVWLRKIRDNERFTKTEAAALATALNEIASEAAPPTEGLRFGDWEAEQCGKLDLPDPDDEIPIPFAPVLAGVLLAGEVLKEAIFPRDVLNGTYWNTLVGRFMPQNQPRCPGPRPDCPICAKPAFHEQHARRRGGRGA